MSDTSYMQTKVEKEFVNNSGKGNRYPVPKEIKSFFNWGAFWGAFVWGLNNKAPITLVLPLCWAFLFLIMVSPQCDFQTGLYIGALGMPLVTLFLCFWFGKKGNEWAWRNKRFEDLKDFRKKQKEAGAKYYVIGYVIFPTLYVMFLLYIFLVHLPLKLFNNESYFQYLPLLLLFFGIPILLVPFRR